MLKLVPVLLLAGCARAGYPHDMSAAEFSRLTGYPAAPGATSFRGASDSYGSSDWCIVYAYMGIPTAAREAWVAALPEPRIDNAWTRGDSDPSFGPADPSAVDFFGKQSGPAERPPYRFVAVEQQSADGVLGVWVRRVTDASCKDL